MMKRLLIILSIVWMTQVELYAVFQPWAKDFLALRNQIDDNNITQKEIEKFTEKENQYFETILETILLNKKDFFNEENKFDKEIFTLERMIDRNKRKHNKYAVLRDEALIKSYKLLHIQHKMVKNIFHALDYYDIETFKKKMNDLFAKSQMEIRTMDNVNYKPYLTLNDNNTILKQAQKNIRDYYSFMELNSNVLKYFSISSDRIYRLNKYAQHNMLSSALYINNLPMVKRINPYLEQYGLNVIKILLIMLVSLVIYFIRKVLYNFIEKRLLKTKYLKRYAQEILDDIRTPIGYLLLIINMELALYIYNEFSIFSNISQIFNVLYAVFFTIIIYQVINSIARVKIKDISTRDKRIKDEMINVAIKIINFYYCTSRYFSSTLYCGS